MPLKPLREALKQDPANERAPQKLQEMAGICRGWGDSDLERGNFERARQNYEKILVIFPEDRGPGTSWRPLTAREQEEARRVAREEHEESLRTLEREGVVSVPPEERK